MGTTAEKLSKLLGTKAAIKAAIEEKGQLVSDSDTFASYPGKIRSIETGKDVSSVTATAGDVLAGKKFVDSSGAVVTGTIPAKTASDLTANGATVTVPAGHYAAPVSKAVTDTNLKAENVRAGVTIFGVAGNMQEGISTSDATAAASDIISGKTAYVKGSKVTGSLTPIPVLSGTTEPDASLGEDGTIYLVLEA